MNASSISKGQAASKGQTPLDATEEAPRALRPRMLLATTLGAALTGAALAGALSIGAPLSSGASAELSPIAAAQLDDAARTLNPAQTGQLVADAKSCKIPLAYVSLWTADGSPQTVRIRSGNYVSPPFALTGAPQRVAIPFPAPYAAGRGTLSIEGQGRNVAVSLTPAWSVASLVGQATTNVIWTPKNPC